MPEFRSQQLVGLAGPSAPRHRVDAELDRVGLTPELIAEPDWRLKCAKAAPLDIGPILDPRAAKPIRSLILLALPRGLEPLFSP
jgi:hypothetical protein